MGSNISTPPTPPVLLPTPYFRSTTNVVLQRLTLQPVTFTFDSVRMPQGAPLGFTLIATNAAHSTNILISVEDASCPQVVELGGLGPPYGPYPPFGPQRHVGLDLVLSGARSLQVANGWSIQAAIDAARPGETVNVGPGTYHEDIYLKSGVNVIGAGLSSTILRGTGTNNVVNALSVTNARLAGFTITGAGTNGNCCSSGVNLQSSTLVVDNNRIAGNVNGIMITHGSPIIRNNIIQGNGCPTNGCSFQTEGIWGNYTAALIANNLIVSNFCEAIYLAGCNAQLVNNTIANNLGGINCQWGDKSVLKNNIVAANYIGIQAVAAGTSPVISYNDVWGNSLSNYDAWNGGVAGPGPGDISTDPLFDSTSPVRFALAAASPCIHAGDPDPSFNNPDGTRNTMGAYGGASAMTPLTGIGMTSGFLFTSIGLVPTAVITNLGPLAGLANVPADVASALYLPAWRDAPFGGQPYLYGLFGSSDDSVQYYQIWGAPWQGGNPPAATNFQPILDPLSKYKYVIQTNGTVQMTLVNVGPDAQGLYLRTDRPDSGYWSAPDLKLVLNTYRLQNGQWDFICAAYTGDSATARLDLPTNQLSRATLWIDNNPVTVSISSVRDQSGSVIPECGMIFLATNTQNLQFEITAYHPSGFLDSYYLESYYGRNRDGGTIVSDHYVGVHDGSGSRPSWSGVPATQIINSQPAQLAGQLQPWQTCAYGFTLGATARTINGFNRIYGAWFSDHYYITVGTTISSCAADLNHDGRVDGLDLALFAAHYGLTNCTPSPLVAPAQK